MHICVGKLAIIGSDNGLSPRRRQAIIWTNAGILLIEPLGTNFNFNRNWSIFIEEKAFEDIVCEMASILSQPQCYIHMADAVYWLHICLNKNGGISMKEEESKCNQSLK